MRSPYKAEEGPPEKEAELVRKPPGGGPKPAVVHHSVGPTKQAVQRTGHDVVEMVEKRAGRNPISHAGQTKVGYDYESSGRKIEVKDFQMEDPPVFGLDDYEMKVAKEEGDSYWVYIVAGLREGASTVVYAIQNPLKYLKSKPPPLEEFEDWKPAVREEYPIEEKGDRVDDKKEGEDAGASEDKR